MNSITLTSPGKVAYSLDFPATWNELTAPEMELVCGLLTGDEKDEHKLKAAIFAGLLKMRANGAKANLGGDWLSRINPEDVGLQGMDAIDFLFTKNERTVNPFPTLKLAGISGNNSTFYGPADGFADLSCAQMEDAETILALAGEKITTDTMASLASVLYHLPSSRIDTDTWTPAQEYLPKKSERLQPNFATLPVAKLAAILYWYIGCRAQLPKLFPKVYGGGGKGAADPAAFTKCIHAGAGTKNGLRDNIRKMSAMEFLFDMNNEASLAAEQEKEVKKAGKKGS